MQENSGGRGGGAHREGWAVQAPQRYLKGTSGVARHASQENLPGQSHMGGTAARQGGRWGMAM